MRILSKRLSDSKEQETGGRVMEKSDRKAKDEEQHRQMMGKSKRQTGE